MLYLFGVELYQWHNTYWCIRNALYFMTVTKGEQGAKDELPHHAKRPKIRSLFA